MGRCGDWRFYHVAAIDDDADVCKFSVPGTALDCMPDSTFDALVEVTGTHGGPYNVTIENLEWDTTPRISATLGGLCVLRWSAGRPQVLSG